MSEHDTKADEIVRAVLATFDALPNKAKPRAPPDGTKEWTVLCGVVLSYDTGHGLTHKCVALGTGMKCLPSLKLPLTHGNCLHDSHAEIIAIRAFNLFLLNECEKLLRSPEASSDFLESSIAVRSNSPDSSAPHFVVKPNIEISIYCSEAPCGDASMELVMSRQEDARPWQDSSDSEAPKLPGRGYFSRLGVVRRKPARGDAPPSLSKSCSDKLALNQATSLLSSFASLFIAPSNAYLSRLVVPQHRLSPGSFERAFGETGRMSHVLSDGEAFTGQYSLKFFKWTATTCRFEFECDPRQNAKQVSASNISTCWTPSHLEVLVNGTKMGWKQMHPCGASSISRRKIWYYSMQLALLSHNIFLVETLSKASYAAVKASEVFKERRITKQHVQSRALRDWLPNSGDDTWALDISMYP